MGSGNVNVGPISVPGVPLPDKVSTNIGDIPITPFPTNPLRPIADRILPGGGGGGKDMQDQIREIIDGQRTEENNAKKKLFENVLADQDLDEGDRQKLIKDWETRTFSDVAANYNWLKSDDARIRAAAQRKDIRKTMSDTPGIRAQTALVGTGSGQLTASGNTALTGYGGNRG